jgi:hypothetical protein
MDTLDLQLRRLRQSLLDYRTGQPDASFLYCVANDEKHFYGLANKEGEILLETTEEAFARLSTVFKLHILRISKDGTQVYALSTKHIESENGILRVDLLVEKAE